MELIHKAGFALDHYLRLSVLVVAAVGAGSPWIGAIRAAADLPVGLRLLISLVAGLGCLILALIALGVAGELNRLAIGALVLLAFINGLVTFYRACRQQRSALAACASSARSGLRVPMWLVAALFVYATPWLLRPLQVPLAWDELMYHLPYVRFWVEQGSLAVDPWLRYPLFPYNYHMLYVVAYLFGSDVLPHLVNALAGWLTAAGLYFAGRRLFSPAVAVIAPVLFLSAVGGGFDSAYIDLGLSLFVFFAFFALALAREASSTGLLLFAALCMGLAVGTKLHGLLYALIWAPLVLLVVRRPGALAGMVAIAALGAAFWYARSFLVSGDPVHPIGARWFGYWLWDEGDLQGQLADVARTVEWPKWYLMIGFAAVVRLVHGDAVFRATAYVAFASVALWLASSGHGRYLMPAYPFLALLAAEIVSQAAHWVSSTARWVRFAGYLGAAPVRGVRALVVVAAASASIPALVKIERLIGPSEAERATILRQRLNGYAVFEQLRMSNDLRILQVGFEGQLYYAPRGTIGEVFGPGRSRTVLELASDPRALAAHVSQLGANALLINLGVEAFRNVQFAVDMDKYFDLQLRNDQAVLYRLR